VVSRELQFLEGLVTTLRSRQRTFCSCQTLLVYVFLGSLGNDLTRSHETPSRHNLSSSCTTSLLLPGKSDSETDSQSAPIATERRLDFGKLTFRDSISGFRASAPWLSDGTTSRIILQASHRLGNQTWWIPVLRDIYCTSVGKMDCQSQALR
jgi:hypothetical protein